jgi:replicative DNA helicase
MDKELPYDVEAERATLGSVLLQRDAIIVVDGWLQPEFFYLEKHAWIYEAMQICYRKRVPPDTNTVGDELRRRDRLEAIGGMAYLIELANAVPTAVHIEYYGRIVERTATRRRLISAGGRIAALGFDDGEELEASLERAEAELLTVSQRRQDRDFASLAELADRYFERVQVIQADGRLLNGLMTGYSDLDALLCGLQRSDLIILAARPSVGKTSFALCVAYNIALAGAQVLAFSLEMSQDQYFQRVLAMETGMSTQKIRMGALTSDEQLLIFKAMGHLSNVPIFVEDTAGLTLQQLRAKAHRKQAELGTLDLIIVDYLQLMTGARAKDGRTQEVSEISRGLKQLARELDVPIIALSQLSRAVEGRASHVPMLSDLRDSGSIEQDCDVCMFLYSEELYDKETDKKGIIEVHVAKHRNGPLGIAPLRFDPPTTRFHNLERHRAPIHY